MKIIIIIMLSKTIISLSPRKINIIPVQDTQVEASMDLLSQFVSPSCNHWTLPVLFKLYKYNF